jgi:hypothetical protein
MWAKQVQVHGLETAGLGLKNLKKKHNIDIA